MTTPLCLLLRLEGPLQSWGYRSRFSDRDTGLEPSKSGVIGLLCCAVGQDRSVPPTALAELKLHVRVDRQGRLLKDFHTAGGGVFRGRDDYFAPTSSGNKGKNPVITERHYLQDASFLVALEGDDTLLGRLGDAVQDPAWPLSLGRRSCPPAAPVYAGMRSARALQALKDEPLADPADPRVRLVLELLDGDTAGETRQDVPIEWPDRLTRKYGTRFVRSEVMVSET